MRQLMIAVAFCDLWFAVVVWYLAGYSRVKLDVCEILWLCGCAAAVIGAVAPYRYAWARVVFIVAALINLGSWGFFALFDVVGFTTVGH